ncbi:MAG: T9SS type A sorting domain-containing protein, partial [Hymenobacter sp.]
TASELNNDHFDVERSLDGTTFAKVGQLAGQGSQVGSTSYTFLDAGSAAQAPTGQPLYYRLRQVNRDGSSTYSPTRSVCFTAAAPAMAALFPNPAAAATGLDLSALPAGSTYQVLLLDATGRQVHQATLAGGQVQQLDLDKLAAGTYQVLVNGQQSNGINFRQVLRLSKK